MIFKIICQHCEVREAYCYYKKSYWCAECWLEANVKTEEKKGGENNRKTRWSRYGEAVMEDRRSLHSR